MNIINRLAISALLLGFMIACTGGRPDDLGNRTADTFARHDSGVFEGPVARAQCGPGSQPETSEVQGRVSIEDVESGRSRAGYWCNLEEVGHQGNGALWQMAWYEDCAYYGLGVAFADGSTTGFVPGSPVVPAGGTAVVDVSDPTNPVQTATLSTPAMIDPWESLKVNEKRGLLAGSALSIEGPGYVDIYDVKTGLATDCTTPTLMSSAPVGTVGHEGEWAPDGMTYYSSGFISPNTTAVDVSNPNATRTVAVINDGIHGLSLSEDGTRLYAAEFARGSNEVNDMSPPTEEDDAINGLEIWDVSGIQNRSVSASTTTSPSDVIGAVYWKDGAVAQMTIPVTIDGKPYIIFIDEGGGVVEEGQPQSPGMARIIDVSDETNPVVVSKLKNEINMLEHAELREIDGGASGFTYQGHYCSVPKREDPGIVACSYFWQGIRVFDIRDPHHPKEIAYFIPPLDEDDDGRAHTSSQIRFVEERGEMWFTNQTTGFHVVRFTNGVWPFD